MELIDHYGLLQERNIILEQQNQKLRSMVGAVGVLSIGESDTDLLLKGLKDVESEASQSVQLSQIPGIFETQRQKYEEKIADLEKLL